MAGVEAAPTAPPPGGARPGPSPGGAPGPQPPASTHPPPPTPPPATRAALDDVAGIHPALDRLRQLLTSATLLELKATAGGYWAGRPGHDLAVDEDERAVWSGGPVAPA